METWIKLILLYQEAKVAFQKFMENKEKHLEAERIHFGTLRIKIAITARLQKQGRDYIARAKPKISR